MNLRRQLLLVSLLTLCLPWAGYQYVQEMDAAMRFGQLQSLKATAQAVVSRLASEQTLLEELAQPRWRADSSRSLYAQPLVVDPLLDGYEDEWRYWHKSPRHYPPLTTAAKHTVDEHNNGYDAIDHQTVATTEPRMSLSLGVRDQNLWLFASTTDHHIVYHNPSLDPLASGDHLRLRTRLADGRLRDYVLSASAPGLLTAVYQDADMAFPQQEARLQGVWQEHSNGFQIELRLPQSLVSEYLGVAWVNRNTPLDSRIQPMGRARKSQPAEWLGNIGPDDAPPFWLLRSDRLQAAVDIFARPDLQLQLVAPNSGLVMEAGGLAGSADVASDLPAWQARLYRWLLKEAQMPNLSQKGVSGFIRSPEVQRAEAFGSGAAWYEHQGRPVGRVALAVHNDQGELLGVVLAAQSSDQMLALTHTAFYRLLLYTLLAVLIAGGGLLAFASVLSWRIKTLSHQVSAAVGDKGQVEIPFKPSSVQDEVGQLSRHYYQMLVRLKHYNDYLKTLANKLSHELRTPLAVIRTSLDNLDQEPLSDSANVFAQRALQGSERLSGILTAMSSASRIEEAIRQAELEEVPLASMLASVTAAYQDLLPGHKIRWSVAPPLASIKLLVAPELLVQMLDKLIDNAADYCPLGGEISVQLLHYAKGLEIRVSNDGPLLPTVMQDELFESLVSLRESQANIDSGEKIHLGLGLHIVKLVAEFHRGQVIAQNREDLSGVMFRILLPISSG